MYVIREGPRAIFDKRITLSEALEEIESLTKKVDRKGRPIWTVTGDIQEIGFAEVKHRRRKYPIRYYSESWLEERSCWV